MKSAGLLDSLDLFLGGRLTEEIQKLREEFHARVKETLISNRSMLESLAKLLLEKEVVDRATLDQLLDAQKKAAAAARI